MLRVFRPTSPMSVGRGCWPAPPPPRGLRRCSPGARASSAAWATRPEPRPGSWPAARRLTAVPWPHGVPVWKEGAAEPAAPLHRLVGLALASLFGLLPFAQGERREIVHRFGTLGKVADLAAMAPLERDADRVETVGRPLRERRLRRSVEDGQGLTGASLALSLRRAARG